MKLKKRGTNGKMNPNLLEHFLLSSAIIYLLYDFLDLLSENPKLRAFKLSLENPFDSYNKDTI